MVRVHILTWLSAGMLCVSVAGCAGGQGPLEVDAETSRGDDGGAVTPGDGSVTPGDGSAADSGLDVAPRPAPGSSGCGLGRGHLAGGVQVSEVFSPAAGGERSFYLSVPDSYDASVAQRLIVGYAGTGWTGQDIAPYLGLETTAPQAGEIYVYPDVQWHDFEGWGALGGWLLGPHAAPADGMADIAFTRELVERLGEQYCLDPARIFATGHSWGGDMAAVAGCFLGDLFAAVAPAAANRPYWFEPEQGEVACVGSAAVWTFFGQDDTSFTGQAYPGQYGDEQVAFWRTRHGCDDDAITLSAGDGECVQYVGCSEDTRYCLYSPDTGHQIPEYFAATALAWFRSF